MPRPLLVASLLLAALGSVVTIVAGVVAHRRWGDSDEERDVLRPYLAVLGLVAVAGLASTAVAGYVLFSGGLAGSGRIPALPQRLLAASLSLPFELVALPWLVFALRYTGRGSLVTRQRVVAGGTVILLYAGFRYGTLFAAPGLFRDPSSLFGSLVYLTIVVMLFDIVLLVFSGIAVVFLAAYRYRTLSVPAGLVASVPVGAVLLGAQVVGFSPGQFGFALLGPMFLSAGASALLATTRYDLFELRPATAALGEQAVIEELDEPVFVVDTDERVVRLNPAAERQLDVDAGRAVAEPLSAVLGDDVETLRNQDVLEVTTAAGNRTVDPRVSALTDSHGHRVGTVVTLVDVTDRQIREQRIQVLNRILRHNLRNALSVIKGRAEIAATSDAPSESELDDILQATSRLEELSENARTVEQLMSLTDDAAMATSVRETVEGVVAGVESKATVETDAPDATVHLNRDLLSYALSNLVENAVEHNDAADPRVRVTAEVNDGLRVAVADNGPGIPAYERQVIETGEEDALSHGSGLGLWATNWAVQALGGDLAFGESDLGGALVTIHVPEAAIAPDRSSAAAAGGGDADADADADTDAGTGAVADGGPGGPEADDADGSEADDADGPDRA